MILIILGTYVPIEEGGRRGEGAMTIADESRHVLIYNTPIYISTYH